MQVVNPDPVEVIDGFIDLDEAGLEAFLSERGLAMDLADIAFFQSYFQKEGRNPTITEVKVVDTYCRPLPPYHVWHRAYRYLPTMTPACRPRLTNTWLCAPNLAASISRCVSWTWAPLARSTSRLRAL